MHHHPVSGYYLQMPYNISHSEFNGCCQCQCYHTHKYIHTLIGLTAILPGKPQLTGFSLDFPSPYILFNIIPSPICAPVVRHKRCPTSSNPALLWSWPVVCPSFTLLMMLLLPGWPTMGLNRIRKKNIIPPCYFQTAEGTAVKEEEKRKSTFIPYGITGVEFQ